MGGILKQQPRDIVFNLCQYGMGEVWKWGAEMGGHSWRTTGDLGLEKNERLPGFYSIGFKNAEHAEYAGPGRWNDPDYILIGYVGNAHNIEEPPKPTALTRHEQYSYMSMWVLMAAPLFYSGDITRLDPFTLNVLNNAEVIAVDQDSLGRQGRIVRKTDDEFVLVKPMEDGSIAVGLFNLSEARRDITVTAADLGVSGRQRVRDLWRWKEIGTIADAYTASVGRHGVMLVRMWPAAVGERGTPGAMTSRERIAAACAHTEPDRLPVDFGGGFQTGIHVSMVYKLRQALGLDPPGTPVKVVEVYQMLGEIAPDLAAALGVDTVSLHGTGTMFGFPQMAFKPWTLADGTPVLVPVDFNTVYEPSGELRQWPENDRSVPAERTDAGRRTLLRRDHPPGAH